MAGHDRLKMGPNHLFRHPTWSGIFFEKVILLPWVDKVNPCWALNHFAQVPPQTCAGMGQKRHGTPFKMAK